MQVSLAVISILLFATASSTSVENLASVGSTLELVHVVFRHGDRTPDATYPNDPYTVESFYPVGLGQLTNNGKVREYNLGKSLRAKYGQFLGEVYTPQDLHCVSSHYDRAKTSLQLVLAGLYPPASIQSWNDDLNWQPIPCDYLKKEENTLFVPILVCPNYPAMQNQSILQSRSDPIYLKYQHLLPYLREMTGDQESDLIMIGAFLYDTLMTQEAYGLELPTWTSTVYPNILREIFSHLWGIFLGTPESKILAPGFLMSKIVNNTYLTINGDSSVNGRKLYLYSGHDLNVASILHFLDRTEPRIINFGAHVIIEVHKILGIRFFRFLLENYAYQTPEPLFVPNCGYFCPVDVFANLYADVLDPLLLHDLCYN